MTPYILILRHQKLWVKLLNLAIGLVWLINGLVCKILDLVPRHQAIVARILGSEYARQLTWIIGLSEVLMAVWIWSCYHRRINAILQMLVVATMNVIEFLLAPDLLLWGRWNIVFACLFIALVYWKEFYLEKKLKD